MMKEKKQISKPSDSLEEQKEELQQDGEMDAPLPSVAEDQCLVSDSNKPVPGTSAVSSGRGAIIVPNIEDSVQASDQKQLRVDHNITYKDTLGAARRPTQNPAEEHANVDRCMINGNTGPNPVNHQYQRMKDLTYKDTVRPSRHLDMIHGDAEPNTDHGKAMEGRCGPSVRNSLVGGIASPNDTGVHVEDASTLENDIPDNTNDNATMKQNNKNRVTDQQQTGAIHVAGIDALLARDNLDDDRPTGVEPADLESSSGVDISQHGQTMIDSMPLEVDGFVPSVAEPRYLVPEGNVQILDHLYASTEPASQANNRTTQHQSRTSMKQFIKKYWFPIMLIMIIIVSIVVASICITGNCHGPDSPPEITVNSSPETTTVTYKSFATKEELIYAVDNFTSGQNITPTLEEIYGNISEWNVSQIQDFSYLFALSRNNVNQKFDSDISRWDVSSATNMSNMFEHATKFRGDLSKWNISRVTDMSYFMSKVTYFNSNLSQWDTSRLENAQRMFFWTNSYEGIGLERWNVSKVYNMSGMFQSCDSFHGDVSKWDVSNVRDMSLMFGFAYRFDRNLSLWDVSNVKNTSWMFYGASSFRGVGLENWDTSTIRDTNAMFCKAESFDGNLSLWDLSNVKNTSFMFFEASVFRGAGLENWDTSKVETVVGMFYSATLFDANLSSWDISDVTDASGMFWGASSFRGVGLEHWDTTKVEKMAYMFFLAASFDGNLSSWNVSNVIDTSYMFGSASSFQGIGLKNWDTANIETMRGMFCSATSFDGNLSSWDVSRVSYMSLMFQNAISFRGDGLDVWNISQVINTAYMFDSAVSFNADLSRWDISHIENAANMFSNATSFAGVFWWDNTTDSLTSQDV